MDEKSSYGGPLIVAINQCRELIRLGHDAHICAGWTGSGPVPTQLEGVPAHLFPVRGIIPGLRFSGLISFSMLAWLWKNARSFDIAHLHTARDLIPLSAASIFRRVSLPYTTQTHGMVLPDTRSLARVIDRSLTLPTLRHAKARFVLTDVEDQAIGALLGSASNTTRLPNGIASIDKPCSTSSTIEVIFMARLHPRKRVMDFADAALALTAENFDARFTVVGPDDGDLPKLRAFIAAHTQLNGRLQYEGSVPHASALSRLAQADIFVLPSIDEPFPMTLLEALALGLPSICTDSCGLATDLAEHDAAIIVRPGAPHLINALRALLQDPSRREMLSEHARRTVRDKYSIQAVGQQLIGAYVDARVDA